MVETHAPADAPTDRRRHGTFGELAALAAIVALVLAYLQPQLILLDTTPAGSDIGAHTWGPWILRDLLLDGRLVGWSDDWYGGMPVYRYYFPLPALLAVVLSLVVPLGVAMKLTVAISAILLPVSAWWAVRAAGGSRPGPVLAAVATLPVLFMVDNLFYGASLHSAVLGEFSFSYGMAFAVVFLGAFARSAATGRYTMLTGVVGAACVLSHVVPAIMAAAAAVVILAVNGRGRHWMTGLAAAAVAGGLSAFWWVPVAVTSAYTYTPGVGGGHGPEPWLMPLPVLVAPALVQAVRGLRQRDGLSVGLTVWAVVGLLGALYAPDTVIHPVRFLPFWYVGVALLAGAAAASGLRWLAARTRALLLSWLQAATLFTAVAAVLATSGLPFLVSRDPETATTDIRNHADWAFRGYEGLEGWPNFEALLGLLAEAEQQRGCGRVLAEHNPSSGLVFGSPFAPSMLPYFTDGCMDAANGLLAESSATAPFMMLARDVLSPEGRHWVGKLPERDPDPSLGVGHARHLGVRYLLVRHPAVVDELAGRDDADLFGVAAGWSLFDLGDPETVQALEQAPEYDPTLTPDWELRAVERFLDPGVHPTATAEPVGLAADVEAPVRITDVTATNGRVSFQVSQVGAPVLIKVSHHPSWRADGARGPYRATPNWMVVVPTEHQVELTWKPGLESQLATALTLLTAAAMTAAASRHRWTRRRRSNRQ